MVTGAGISPRRSRGKWRQCVIFQDAVEPLLRTFRPACDQNPFACLTEVFRVHLDCIINACAGYRPFSRKTPPPPAAKRNTGCIRALKR